MKINSYLILILLCLFSFNLRSQDNNNRQGRIAPDFTLESTEGENISLKNFTGKGPVLISFIGVGCVTCVQELAEYQKIYKEFKDSGFVMLAIPLLNEKNISRVKPFIKSKGYIFPVLLDPNGETARKYFVHEVPYSLLINKEGRIVYSHSGYTKGDEIILRQKIKESL